MLATDRLYDWVAFEFGAYHFGLQHRLPPGTPLARISQPHTQLVIAETEVRFGDADTRYTRVLQRLLADGVPAAPPGSSVWCWLAAVACGVLESLVNAVTSPAYNVAVQLSIRAVVYVLVTLLIVRLCRVENWVRLALTVLLGHADLKNRLADGLYISVTSKGQPQVYFRRSIDSSLPGAHQVVHLGDLSLLSGDDHLRQLDRIRTLTMGDLGVRHGHRALVVIDHRRQPQVVEGRAAQ
ncbi:MAG: salicylate synthetase [Mycobacterium sp.]|nr:salicylate synthetase [Mycobacterium sp.]